ncbi:MAG: TonB-dependent receptor [Planctomycetota bacterium]
MRYIIILLYLFLLPALVLGQQAQKQGYFNPDISVIADTFYQSDNSKDGMANILSNVSGFNHPLNAEFGPDNGFNMNELEIFISANVDAYFKGWAIPVLEPDGAEMEEAVIQTTGLPYGLQLKAGKFFSDFGRVNPQHLHAWDFSDLPLIYRLTLGVEAEGLNDNGLQVSWLAPTDYYILTGLEMLQGNNELMFNYVGEDPLPEKAGPRLFIGWVKFAPNLSNPQHALQLGISGASGIHQEILDNDADGTDDQWLSGINQFWGLDFVYKYDSLKSYGQGKWVVQGEYLNFHRNLEVEQDTLTPLSVGKNRKDTQDGFYLQATYGFLPRWRLGLRYDQVGLINQMELPSGLIESPDASNRITAMTDWSLTEFSRIRFQFSQGNYELAGRDEKVSQVFLNMVISLGAHGAHKF